MYHQQPQPPHLQTFPLWQVVPTHLHNGEKQPSTNLTHLMPNSINKQRKCILLHFCHRNGSSFPKSTMEVLKTILSTAPVQSHKASPLQPRAGKPRTKDERFLDAPVPRRRAKTHTANTDNDDDDNAIQQKPNTRGGPSISVGWFVAAVCS